MHLASFTGFLQADAYAGYEALYSPARTRPGPIIEVACWAHCRRKIFDVWETTVSSVARRRSIGSQCSMRSRLRLGFVPPEERVRHRAGTAPLVDGFFDWKATTLAKMSAKSALVEAFRYAPTRRAALSRFITDGRLQADNNIAENVVRGISRGRKNWGLSG